MKDPGSPTIRQLRHRVALCTQRDVVVDSQTMELRRTDVVWAWARIKSYFGRPAFMGPIGYPSISLGQPVTHGITVRDGLVEVADTAYVYELPRKSQPRWYKIMGFSEPDGWLVLSCRLVEKSDFAIPPQNSLAPQPTDVSL